MILYYIVFTVFAKNEPTPGAIQNALVFQVNNCKPSTRIRANVKIFLKSITS